MIVIMMKAIMNVVHTLVFRVSHLSYSDENDEHDESDHEHCMCFVSQDKSCHTAIVIMMKVNMSIVSAFFSLLIPCHTMMQVMIMMKVIMNVVRGLFLQAKSLVIQ